MLATDNELTCWSSENYKTYDLNEELKKIFRIFLKLSPSQLWARKYLNIVLFFVVKFDKNRLHGKESKIDRKIRLKYHNIRQEMTLNESIQESLIKKAFFFVYIWNCVIYTILFNILLNTYISNHVITDEIEWMIAIGLLLFIIFSYDFCQLD